MIKRARHTVFTCSENVNSWSRTKAEADKESSRRQSYANLSFEVADGSKPDQLSFSVDVNIACDSVPDVEQLFMTICQMAFGKA